jgi:Transposase DDE domain
MHTRTVLQKLLHYSFPTVHRKRLTAVQIAVDSINDGAAVSITTMGRHLASGVRIKHRIKRMDRLVGNSRLYAQRKLFYRAMSQWLLKAIPQPVILIDWSDFSKDRKQQLLRAAIPVGGRSITLYEELHPIERLSNREVQHRFLIRLRAILPERCTPIIIANSGFRVPFYRHVESLGWHWLGRIRGRDFIAWQTDHAGWFPAKTLYQQANGHPTRLGEALWVRSGPLAACLYLVRQPKRGRHAISSAGIRQHSKHSKKNAKRENEPWLLVASPTLKNFCARRVVNLYKTRMQIEENFRDTKSASYGLGIARENRTTLTRASNLFLIAALASMVLWANGTFALQQKLEHLVIGHSSSKRPCHSAIYIARLLMKYVRMKLPASCLTQTQRLIRSYNERLLYA